MLGMKTLLPALALMSAFVPLAANARRMVSPVSQPGQMLIQMSGAQPVNSFSQGRMAERSSNDMAPTQDVTRYALVNTNADAMQDKNS